jgi:hypothetical protein
MWPTIVCVYALSLTHSATSASRSRGCVVGISDTCSRNRNFGNHFSGKPVYRPLEPEHIGKQMPTYLILAPRFARSVEVSASLFELRIFGLGLL